MALDPSIPLQFRFPEIQGPANSLAKVQGIRNLIGRNDLMDAQAQDYTAQAQQRVLATQAAEAQKQREDAFWQSLPDPPEDAPPQFRAALQGMKAGALPRDFKALQELAQGPKRKIGTAKPGDVVFDEADPSKPLLTVPEKPTQTNLAKLISERDALPAGDPRRSLYEAEIAKQTTHAPATSVSVNTGQKGLDNTLKLRGEFKSEPIYKAHQEVQSAYAQIQQSLKQASPAGDLAGATKIMKLLDPGSVVRESELGMAMAASGLFDRITNYAQMTLSGQKLTPTQRKDFQTLADALYGESVKQYNTKRDEYKGIATRNALPEVDVIGNPATAPKGGWSIQKVN